MTSLLENARGFYANRIREPKLAIDLRKGLSRSDEQLLFSLPVQGDISPSFTINGKKVGDLVQRLTHLETLDAFSSLANQQVPERTRREAAIQIFKLDKPLTYSKTNKDRLIQIDIPSTHEVRTFEARKDGTFIQTTYSAQGQGFGSHRDIFVTTRIIDPHSNTNRGSVLLIVLERVGGNFQYYFERFPRGNQENFLNMASDFISSHPRVTQPVR